METTKPYMMIEIHEVDGKGYFERTTKFVDLPLEYAPLLYNYLERLKERKGK